MGNFTDGTPPPPAPDYPPENAIDIGAAIGTAWTAMQKAGAVSATGAHKIAYEPGWLIKELISGAGMVGDVLSTFLTEVGIGYEPILAAMLKLVLAILGPAVSLGGDLAHSYVGILVDNLTGRTNVTSANMGPGAAGAAKGMFDGIMSPLMGLTAAQNPATAGAGQANAQYTLGALVSIQLNTWIVNIISNLTGVGVLKFINSFDECITGSLNTRALGRGAMKPYLDKFMATPLTRDLNVALPLAVGSSAMLIKRYLRGDIDGDGVKRELRKLGYDDSVAADILLDSAKLLDVSATYFLVKNGQWTSDQAIHHLQQSGYPLSMAIAVYEIEQNQKVEAQTNALAEDLLTLLKDHRIDRPAFVTALQSAGFTAAEVQAYSLRGAYAQEIPKRLTYAQVKALYLESLVNMDYVLSFLTAEGYSNDDADLLVLHEFTAKEYRDNTRLLLANIRRGTLEKQLGDVAAANLARQKALSMLPA
jgi:hypothetical protein